jgi:hypothetical protein
MPYPHLLGTQTRQDVVLDRLCMDVAQHNAPIMVASRAESAADLACRDTHGHSRWPAVALKHRGASCPHADA